LHQLQLHQLFHQLHPSGGARVCSSLFALR
jgi:hypothetical protein